MSQGLQQEERVIELVANNVLLHLVKSFESCFTKGLSRQVRDCVYPLTKCSNRSLQENHLLDPRLELGAVWIILDLFEGIVLFHKAGDAILLVEGNVVQIHSLYDAVGTLLNVLEPLKLVDLLERHQLDVRDPLQRLVQIIIGQEVSSDKTLDSICLGLTRTSVVSEVSSLAR